MLGASGRQVQRCVASSRTESTRSALTTTMRSSPTWRVPPVTEPSLTVLPVRRSIEELSGLTMARSATTTPEMAMVAQSPESPSVSGSARAGRPTPSRHQAGNSHGQPEAPAQPESGSGGAQQHADDVCRGDGDGAAGRGERDPGGGRDGLCPGPRHAVGCTGGGGFWRGRIRTCGSSGAASRWVAPW